MKRLLNIGFILLVIGVQSLTAQSKKQELRGVWVTTLLNIDWPSSDGLSTSQQKQEIIEILDAHQSQGINAIFLQVRPASDAFYASSYEPWSNWLTGRQGQEPRPYYDPLGFWIKEAHMRGMELHAWFNPFRAAVSDETSRLHADHVINRHPQWFINYAGRVYFDPGLPQVRDYVTKIVAEVASKYAVDGVHFDDYFYPYGVAGEVFDDSRSFEQSDHLDLPNWRRDNINQFIKACADTLKSINPEIRFGISPFGVWRNQDKDPAGSATRAGHTNYDDLYADVIMWMKAGWIDYLAPQIYWHIGYNLADYQVLLKWWSQHAYGRHIYVGQSAYKVRSDADFESWRSATELSRHLRLNRNYPEIQGNIYFSSTSLRTNSLGLGDTLSQYHYNHPAIVPPMDYKPLTSLSAPDVFRISHGFKKLTLYWSDNLPEEDCRYLLVYRFKGEAAQGIQDAAKIVARLAPGTTSFEDTPPKKGYYTYVVTAVSKSNHESKGSYGLTINYRKRPPRKKKAKA